MPAPLTVGETPGCEYGEVGVVGGGRREPGCQGFPSSLCHDLG